jgi:DNA-binding NtrC family response regulator
VGSLADALRACKTEPQVTRTTQPYRSSELVRIDAASGRLRSREYQLNVVAGPGEGQSTPLKKPLVIGSADDADLRVQDATVSRHHVELKPSSGGVWVRDLGSMNGTVVAGARIEQAFVEAEATLSLGQTMVRISIVENDLGAPLGPETFGTGVVGHSLAMRRVFGLLERMAKSDATIVLLGETGTGKEVLAGAVHAHSPRAMQPFVVFDCRTVAHDLLESALFGHTRGAFTGAVDNRPGAFARADGGTLFLDEIGELPLEMQPRLLRALDSGEVKPVGEDAYKSYDVRVIASSHHDLEALTRDGRFRKDLFFRLAVAMVQVPPLRQRVEDIPLLVRHFVRETGREDFELTVELRDRMMAYGWPGNVRELRNAVDRALLGEIDALQAAHALAPSRGEVALDLPFKEAKERLIEGFTRDYLAALLHKHAGNVSRAARAAGIARPHLHKLVVKYGLKAAHEPE